ncbi:hypothetical protein RRG08_013664 [Elysia crispata]|uniref:PiggyBac transposable element-derived protein domain-containing protein n=1 Tax=Elysia crispata TaxID=231223 RepID=A0AAE1A1L1_9GAST|nr:hypothetical protein RRG08_013664 [Elysia crispata]
MLFDQDLLKKIKSESNIYPSSELRKRTLKPHSLFRNWKPLKLEDVHGFLCILVHKCLVNKKELADYRSTEAIDKTDFASIIMSWNRFMQILLMLHLNNNATCVPWGSPNHNPLHKYRPVLDLLNSKYKELYIPDRKMSIDEAICRWRGRLIFRVYMKDKPNKWCIEL